VALFDRTITGVRTNLTDIGAEMKWGDSLSLGKPELEGSVPQSVET